MEMETQIREALARGYCSPENKHNTDEPAKDARPNREVPWDIWGREETFIARF